MEYIFGKNTIESFFDSKNIIEVFIANNFSDEKLKEFVGHTPLQVFFGAILGIIVSCVIYFNFL